MNNQIVVYGAGGHGKVVAESLVASGRTPSGFIDDNPTMVGKVIAGLAVLVAEEWLRTHVGCKVALGIGDNRARDKAAQRVKSHGCKLLTAIHPSAIIATTARIGDGVAIMPAAVLNPDCEIGEGAIINTAAIVEHDVCIGRYAHLAPRSTAAGSSQIGEYSLLGIGANVLPLKRVGANCIIGAGAVVIDDIPDGDTAFGVPARVHRATL